MGKKLGKHVSSSSTKDLPQMRERKEYKIAEGKRLIFKSELNSIEPTRKRPTQWRGKCIAYFACVWNFLIFCGRRHCEC